MSLAILLSEDSPRSNLNFFLILNQYNLIPGSPHGVLRPSCKATQLQLITFFTSLFKNIHCLIKIIKLGCILDKLLINAHASPSIKLPEQSFLSVTFLYLILYILWEILLLSQNTCVLNEQKKILPN